MKKCKSCFKDIEDSAKKCDKCGSYQNFTGRFINTGIPIISILLAMVSWGQTYIETQARKAAVLAEETAHNMAIEAKAKMESAIMLEEEARQKAEHYEQTLIEVDREVQQLKVLNRASPTYQQKLNTITHKLEIVKEPIREIDGQQYRRIE